MKAYRCHSCHEFKEGSPPRILRGHGFWFGPKDVELCFSCGDACGDALALAIKKGREREDDRQAEGGGVSGVGVHVNEFAECANSDDHGMDLKEALRERDDAHTEALQLRAERDLAQDSAHASMAEFANADDQRIAAWEELARMREERNADRDYAQADVAHWVALSVKREHERDKAKREQADHAVEAMRCIFQLGVLVAQLSSERDKLQRERANDP